MSKHFAAACLLGCVGLFAGCAVPAAQSTEHFADEASYEIRTIAQNEEGVMVDEGLHVYSESTLRLIQLTKFRGLKIDEDGRVRGYIPVGYAEGVSEPAPGTLLEWELLDEKGQVLAWQAVPANDPPPLPCKMAILPGGLRVCNTITCPNPCVLTYEYDPETGQIVRIYCDCPSNP